ncbi:hypothetical protein M0802_008110 [Mischocyttarus mexicanus]|nr:hypothetical protein M0802_008110 [Mischocyttarus mexicanus]
MNQMYTNAFDEECRAQKALNLLKARDRRIAYLEKRVIELEKTAIGMHAMSLRASSTLSSLDGLQNKDVFYNISQNEPTMKLDNDYKNSYSLKKDDLTYEQIKSLSDQGRSNLKLLASNVYKYTSTYRYKPIEVSNRRARSDRRDNNETINLHCSQEHSWNIVYYTIQTISVWRKPVLDSTIPTYQLVISTGRKLIDINRNGFACLYIDTSIACRNDFIIDTSRLYLKELDLRSNFKRIVLRSSPDISEANESEKIFTPNLCVDRARHIRGV